MSSDYSQSKKNKISDLFLYPLHKNDCFKLQRFSPPHTTTNKKRVKHITYRCMTLLNFIDRSLISI